MSGSIQSQWAILGSPARTVAYANQDILQTLPPGLGIMDIVVAILIIAWPIRIVLVWAVIWAFATALARPIAGDPAWDFVERASNWAAPLALLSLQGFPQKIKHFFDAIKV